MSTSMNTNAAAITGNTRVFAILADPIHHVKTPQRINALFEAAGFDGVMVPLHVPPAALATLLQGLRALPNFQGCVVTVPHKTSVLALCDELTPAARMIGAANVIRRTEDGRLIGGMLDGDGFVAGLLSRGFDPASRSAYVAGAGGAASAIAFALAARGVRSLTIGNRSADKARELLDRVAAAFPQVAVQVGGRDTGGAELVVNATSLGMRDDDELPLDVQTLRPEQFVAEIIMQPEETALLAAARARGCTAHPGAPMLASQIALMAEFMSGGALKADRA